MKSGKNIFKLSRSQWISVAVLASSLGLAAAVTLPFPTFTAGTPASATQVTQNFTTLATAVTTAEAALTAAQAQITALNGKLPLVFAATDTTLSGVIVTAGGRTTINSVPITVPAAGFLVISGFVFINNDGVANTYVLNPLIDGVDVFPGVSFQGVFNAAADGVFVAEFFTMSYTITVPITAGAHTIDQVAGPNGGTSNFFYNRNNLTILFLPSSQVTFTPLFVPAQTAVPQQVGSNPLGQ